MRKHQYLTTQYLVITKNLFGDVVVQQTFTDKQDAETYARNIAKSWTSATVVAVHDGKPRWV